MVYTRQIIPVYIKDHVETRQDDGSEVREGERGLERERVRERERERERGLERERERERERLKYPLPVVSLLVYCPSI